MYLKRPFWSEALSSPESQGEQKSPVLDLVKSLDKQRLYREVTLALGTGLRETRAEFSFIRIRGLRSILKFLRSAAESDETINLFCYSQSIPELQGIFHEFSSFSLFKKIYIILGTWRLELFISIYDFLRLESSGVYNYAATTVLKFYKLHFDAGLCIL